MVVCGLKVTVLWGRGGCVTRGVGGGSSGDDSSAGEGMLREETESGGSILKRHDYLMFSCCRTGSTSLEK